MSTSSFQLKREIHTSSAPAPDQLLVGELVLNAITGRLYTKLESGQIIQFTGEATCYNAVPSISFSSVANFCCISDLLTVTISGLKNASAATYSFEMEDLSNNTITIQVSSPIYQDYNTYPAATVEDPQAGIALVLREAIVPISIAILGTKNISTLKFKIRSENIVVAERIITINCNKEC